LDNFDVDHPFGDLPKHRSSEVEVQAHHHTKRSTSNLESDLSLDDDVPLENDLRDRDRGHSASVTEHSSRKSHDHHKKADPFDDEFGVPPKKSSEFDFDDDFAPVKKDKNDFDADEFGNEDKSSNLQQSDFLEDHARDRDHLDLDDDLFQDSTFHESPHHLHKNAHHDRHPLHEAHHSQAAHLSFAKDFDGDAASSAREVDNGGDDWGEDLDDLPGGDSSMVETAHTSSSRPGSARTDTSSGHFNSISTSGSPGTTTVGYKDGRSKKNAI
jgi:hypothetical protein